MTSFLFLFELLTTSNFRRRGFLSQHVEFYPRIPSYFQPPTSYSCIRSNADTSSSPSTSQNFTEKIMQRYAVGLPVGKFVRSGDYVSIKSHHCMTDDNSWPVAQKLFSIGATKIHDNCQIVMTLDHDVHKTSQTNLRSIGTSKKERREWGWTFRVLAEELDIKFSSSRRDSPGRELLQLLAIRTAMFMLMSRVLVPQLFERTEWRNGAQRCSTKGGYQEGCNCVNLCLCAVFSITTRFSAMPSSFLVQNRLYSRLQLMIVWFQIWPANGVPWGIFSQRIPCLRTGCSRRFPYMPNNLEIAHIHVLWTGKSRNILHLTHFQQVQTHHMQSPSS